MRNINLFEMALKKNEIDKCLLGEGEYFVDGGEMGRNLHSGSSIWWDIKDYVSS